MNTSYLSCYTCDLTLSQQETYYIYQCTKCSHRTSYCLRCNKTMDALLNSTFFKCFCCKVLTRIVNRESISPNNSNNNINRMLYNNTFEGNNDNEIKGLFHPNMQSENNTPIKNLIAGCFNPLPLTGFNQQINNNLINNQAVNGNLLKNFNQAIFNANGDGFNTMNRHEDNSNNTNNQFQTPKNNYKFERNCFFSPEDNFQTPIQNKTMMQDPSSNLRNMNVGFSTPRNISKKASASESNYKIHKNNLQDEGAFSIDEFEKMLVLQKNPQVQNNDIQKNYDMLANRSRVNKIFGNKLNLNNLEINKINNKGNIIEGISSEFAGYNKTESSCRNYSKSPLSMRKRGKHSIGPSEASSYASLANNNNNNFNRNQNNMETNQRENTLLLSNFKQNSFINTEQNLHHQQKFGMNSSLSDIKPVTNYTNFSNNTNFDNSSKFSFSTNNGYNNFFKMNPNN